MNSTGRVWARIRRIAASDRISGLIMLAFAFAGLVLANLPWTSHMFEAVAETQLGIPGTNIILPIGHWAQDGLLTIFFLTVGLDLKQELTTGSLADPKAAAEAAKNLPGLTSKQALKTPTFWFFFIFMVLLTGTLAFASIVPTLAIEAGFDTVTSGFAMTAYMIGTAIAAVVFGTISDKLGPLKATMVACACGFIALLGLIFFRTNLYMFFGSLFFYGCLSATLGVIGPLVLGTLFGQKEFGSIYGIVMMATGIGSMILIPAYGFIYDATGSFTPALIMIFCFIVVCLISMIMAFKTGKKVQAMWMPKA